MRDEELLWGGFCTPWKTCLAGIRNKVIIKAVTFNCLSRLFTYFMKET